MRGKVEKLETEKLLQCDEIRALKAETPVCVDEKRNCRVCNILRSYEVNVFAAAKMPLDAPTKLLQQCRGGRRDLTYPDLLPGKSSFLGLKRPSCSTSCTGAAD